MGGKVARGIRRFFAILCFLSALSCILVLLTEDSTILTGEVKTVGIVFVILFSVVGFLLWPRNSKQRTAPPLNALRVVPNYNQELDVEQYAILATLDDETCPICGAMDGKVFKRSEYEQGRTAPPFCDECRCTTIPYFSDMAGLGERAARDPKTGETIMVPSSMTYEQWKKKHSVK